MAVLVVGVATALALVSVSAGLLEDASSSKRVLIRLTEGVIGQGAGMRDRTVDCDLVGD